MRRAERAEFIGGKGNRGGPALQHGARLARAQPAMSAVAAVVLPEIREQPTDETALPSDQPCDRSYPRDVAAFSDGKSPPQFVPDSGQIFGHPHYAVTLTHAGNLQLKIAFLLEKRQRLHHAVALAPQRLHRFGEDDGIPHAADLREGEESFEK